MNDSVFLFSVIFISLLILFYRKSAHNILRLSIHSFFIIYYRIKLRIIDFLFGFDSFNAQVMNLPEFALQPILRDYGAVIGENCNIQQPLILNTNSKYKYNNLSIGDNSHIGKLVLLDLLGEIVIGNNVIISFRSTIISHTDLGNSKLKSFYPLEQLKTKINDDCYLGANTTVLAGVNIDKSVIIGANSMVNKDLHSDFVYFGVPAKEWKKL